MKEIWRYKFFESTIMSLASAIIFTFMSRQWEALKIVWFLSIALFIIFLILFLDEYSKSMQIKKDGRFVLGVLESKSIKVHHMGKGRYMLKACVEYYDEEKKVTLKFNGCDFFNNYEIRVGTIKKIHNEDTELEVLVGYLKENPKVCELYLKDAFEKI